jgi:hypothetical protein
MAAGVAAQAMPIEWFDQLRRRVGRASGELVAQRAHRLTLHFPLCSC